MRATFVIEGLEERLTEIERRLDLLLAPRAVWLYAEQAAAYLGITPAALRQRVKREPSIPVHRGLGESSLSSGRPDLDSYVEGHRTPLLLRSGPRVPVNPTLGTELAVVPPGPENDVGDEGDKIIPMAHAISSFQP